MRTSLRVWGLHLSSLALIAGLAGPVAAAPSPSPSLAPGRVRIYLRLRTDSPAFEKYRTSLGFHLTREQRVMLAAPNGGRMCVPFYEGDMPMANVGKLRARPEVWGLGLMDPVDP